VIRLSTRTAGEFGRDTEQLATRVVDDGVANGVIADYPHLLEIVLERADGS